MRGSHEIIHENRGPGARYGDRAPVERLRGVTAGPCTVLRRAGRHELPGDLPHERPDAPGRVLLVSLTAPVPAATPPRQSYPSVT